LVGGDKSEEDNNVTNAETFTNTSFNSTFFRSSAHDAAFCARCLRILATHSDLVKETLLRKVNVDIGASPNNAESSGKVLEALRRASVAGKSHHAVLEMEADRAYAALTCGNS